MKNKPNGLFLFFLLVAGLIGTGMGLWNAYGKPLQAYDMDQNMSIAKTVELSNLPPLDLNRPERTEFALFALG